MEYQRKNRLSIAQQYKPIELFVFGSSARYTCLYVSTCRHRFYHPLVYDGLVSGKGLMLMNKDSEIAESVIKKLIGLGVVVLSGYDSFIVKASHEELLRQAMTEVYSEINLPAGLPPIEV